MDKIAPGLYLGGEGGLHEDYIYHFKITHVLSVLKGSDKPPASVIAHNIAIEDGTEADLLTRVPEGLNFIHMALTGQPLMTSTGRPLTTDEEDLQPHEKQQKEARVFVHCAAGISRSPSMVIAYLMKTREWDFDKALAHVQQCRSRVNPNPGFQKQLELFADMKYTIDPLHPGYRMWYLQYVATSLGFSPGYVSVWHRFDADIPGSFAALADRSDAESKGPLYCCAGCNALLATEANVLNSSHIAGSHKWCTDRLEWLRVYTEMFSFERGLVPAYRRLQTQQPSEISEQTSVFLEPMSWMENVASKQAEGELCCPTCGLVIGAFDWQGIMTKQGNRVAPAFHIRTDKLTTTAGKNAVSDTSTQLIEAGVFTTDDKNEE